MNESLISSDRLQKNSQNDGRFWAMDLFRRRSYHLISTWSANKTFTQEFFFSINVQLITNQRIFRSVPSIINKAAFAQPVATKTQNMDCDSDESERWEDFFGKPYQFGCLKQQHHYHYNSKQIKWMWKLINSVDSTARHSLTREPKNKLRKRSICVL